MRTTITLSTHAISRLKATKVGSALYLMLGTILTLSLFTGCLEENPVDGTTTDATVGPEVGTTFTYSIAYDDALSSFDLSGTETWTLISYLPSYKGKTNVARYSVVIENDYGTSTNDRFVKYEKNGDLSTPLTAGTTTTGGNEEVSLNGWAVTPIGSMGTVRYFHDTVISDALQTIEARSSGTTTYQGSGSEVILGVEYDVHYLETNGSMELTSTHIVNPFTQQTSQITGALSYVTELGLWTNWSYDIRGKILMDGIETPTRAVYTQTLIGYSTPD